MPESPQVMMHKEYKEVLSLVEHDGYTYKRLPAADLTKPQVPLRRCRDCSVEQPATPQYFAWGARRTTGKHFLLQYCHQCQEKRIERFAPKANTP